LELADKWIYSRLNEVIRLTQKNYEELRLNDAANILMDFIWKEFCSWYLELSKDRIYNSEDKEGQLTAKYVLLDVFQTSMRLLQPIMPFITEEIWHGIKEYFPMPEESLVIAEFPKVDNNFIDEKIDKDMTLIQETITVIRTLRKQVNLAPKVEIEIFIKVATDEHIELLKLYENYFLKLAKVTSMKADVDLKKPASSIAAVVQNMEVYLPLEGLIDLDGEREKFSKQLLKLEKELKTISGKLNNTKFIANAPDEIVKKEKEKFSEIETKVNKTKELLAGLN
jgi:valyl-tRNA synthetase